MGTDSLSVFVKWVITITIVLTIGLTGEFLSDWLEK